MAIQTIDSVFVGPQAILDLSTLTTQVNFTGRIPTGVLPTLEVFLNIQHTFNEDLNVSLTNPQGTSIELFTRIGGGSDGFIIILSDAALADISTATTTTGAITGTFNPEGAALLSTLATGNLTGNWTLSVTDAAGGDIGSLFSWGIRATFDYSGTVAGTNLADVLNGSDGVDVMLGLDGDDTVQGFSGNDQIAGGDGNDRLFGGLGNDRISGGNGNDLILGDEDNDQLFGGRGNDRLEGGIGDDLLVGGRGRDVMIGGLGADRFDFNAINESVRGSQRDVVYFNRSEGDEIDLRGIDAERSKSGNQAFHFIGSAAFSGDEGELRFARGILQGDINGDGRADFEIRVVGRLTVADILL